jgi:hypothetical protein
MMRFKPARMLGLAAVAALTMAATPRIAIVPGITFDMVTTTHSEPMAPGSPGGLNLVTHGIATASGASRIDVATADNAQGTYAIGDYILTIDGRPVIVHPTTKTYVDITDMANGALSKLPPQILDQLIIGNVTAKLDKLDGGDVLEGRKTDHYRTTVAYTMSMMGQEIPSVIVTDYWMAKLSVPFMNPMSGRPPATPPAGPMAELMKKQAEVQPPMTDGVVVKSMMTTTITLGAQSQVMTMTSAMTNIKETDVDATKIALPSGYTKAEK